MYDNKENIGTTQENSGAIKPTVELKENSVVVTAGGVSSSREIGQLALALSKAQGQFGIAVKDKQNPFFKSLYSDLNAIINASREALTQNGLAVMQFISGDVTEVAVTTRAMHASGEWLESTISGKPVKQDCQSQGSVASYLRRYSMAAMLGIAQGDDDGQEASKPETLSTEQIEVLDTLINGHDDIRIRLIKAYKALENIKAADFAMILNVVQKSIADKGKK